MSINYSYHSDEKQRIREILWDPAFIDLIDNVGVISDKLKYFCLPGPECIYLDQIFLKFNINKNNIVAIEQDLECAIPIRKKLCGKGIVFEGKLEKIFSNNELINQFPFDIINLDFCGQAFVFSGNEYQKRWDIIKEFIKNNKSKNQQTFYLLLTLLGGRSNKEGKKFLKKNILELNKITGINKDFSEWNEDRLIQEALPKIIIDEALVIGYETTLVNSYRYRQKGHRSNMVTFSFRFDIFRNLLGDNVHRKSELATSILKSYYSKVTKEMEVKYDE